jgi:hypothetical protein
MGTALSGPWKILIRGFQSCDAVQFSRDTAVSEEHAASISVEMGRTAVFCMFHDVIKHPSDRMVLEPDGT